MNAVPVRDVGETRSGPGWHRPAQALPWRKSEDGGVFPGGEQGELKAG